jgi:major type 1 subunit fimbrin (pilin)
MKISLLTGAMALGLGMAATTAAHAADGNINFTGEISDVTCSINGVTPGTGDVNIAVNLPKVSAKALASAGQTAGAQAFAIMLGKTGETTCQNGKVASMHFEADSPAIDKATGMLTVTGGATNVQIGLLNDKGAKINLVDNTNTTQATIVDNQVTLAFVARYEAVNGAAGSGGASSTVRYSIAYN